MGVRRVGERRAESGEQGPFPETDRLSRRNQNRRQGG